MTEQAGLVVAAPLTRKLEFIPAFDRRDSDPNKNYGVAEMRLRFVVIGPKGAIQWVLGTGWYTRSARRHLLGFPLTGRDTQKKPSGYDLGHHARAPQYEGQSAMDSCDLLGGECYYDGSSLQAELPIEGFLTEGDEYVWRKLEELYLSCFEDAEWPFALEAEVCRANGEF